MATLTQSQFGPDPAEVERLATGLHETGLGCVQGSSATTGRDAVGQHVITGMQLGCVADHRAQARVLFGAMIHEHPIE